MTIQRRMFFRRERMFKREGNLFFFFLKEVLICLTFPKKSEWRRTTFNHSLIILSDLFLLNHEVRIRVDGNMFCYGSIKLCYPFIDRDKSNVAIEKILGPESFPSVGRRLIKFQSSDQRNSWSSQICPISNVPSGLVGTHFLARHVPSVGRLRENECPVSRHRSQRSDFYVPSGERHHYDRIYVPSGGRPPPFRPPRQLFHATTAIRRGSSSSTGPHSGSEHFNLSRCSPGAAPSAYGK
jgi:hypothetical protein